MSVIKLFICKEWLLHKNQNWYHNDILIFLLQELKYRNKLYKMVEQAWVEPIINLIDTFLDHF